MKVVFVGSSSMGPRFIIGLLKKHGHTCYGIYQGVESLLGEAQADFFGKPIGINKLLKLDPDIVGFSCCTFDFADLLRMAGLVKQAKPEVLILFGGIHPTIMPDSVISHEVVDIICLGDGEYPVLDLCQALEKGEDITGIANLWVKKNGTIHKNPIRDYPQDLDDLPLDREGVTYMGIFSGRGCYGNCTFCNTPTLRKMGGKGHYFRKRNVANVLDEVGEILSSLDRVYNLGLARALAQKLPGKLSYYGVRAVEKFALIINNRPWLREPFGFCWKILSKGYLPPIRFKDDTFLSNKKWFLEFAPEFQKRFPDIGYICQARANEIDEEVARWLAKSNCVKVSIGIECGNEEFRRKIVKKGVSNEQIIQAVDLLHKYKIPVLGQWILGFPGETPELTLESLQLHCRLGDIPQVHIAAPFPKTAMYDMALEMGFIDESYVPVSGLYDDFLFHSGYEKTLMRVIYNLFPIAGMTVPLDMKELDFAVRAGRGDYKQGLRVGDMIGWDWGSSPGSRAAAGDLVQTQKVEQKD